MPNEMTSEMTSEETLPEESTGTVSEAASSSAPGIVGQAGMEGDASVPSTEEELTEEELTGIVSAAESGEPIEQAAAEHPFLSTPFASYSVVEGLLLVIVLFLFLGKCFDIVRKGLL